MMYTSPYIHRALSMGHSAYVQLSCTCGGPAKYGYCIDTYGYCDNHLQTIYSQIKCLVLLCNCVYQFYAIYVCVCFSYSAVYIICITV